LHPHQYWLESGAPAQAIPCVTNQTSSLGHITSASTNSFARDINLETNPIFCQMEDIRLSYEGFDGKAL
jgi:hypothetical protein